MAALISYLGFALTHAILLVAGLFVFYGLYQGRFRAVGKAFASDFVPELLRASGVGPAEAPCGVRNARAARTARRRRSTEALSRQHPDNVKKPRSIDLQRWAERPMVFRPAGCP